ncbi:MAG: biotin--[acetyl-CoA-carboxylase] ligase [Actinobacteria bacterium]|nr:biotin--[acetyl-CoA-carboxylase] ligase [Actinomycetota bacterium]
MPAWDVRRFPSIDSTNTWIMAQARAGAAEGLVAVADHQSAGRGRLGRSWEAPAGANLLCSVLLRPPRASHLVVAALALAGRDAARSVAGVDAGIKWPNDLVVDDRKLAGVLAESDAGAVAAGIGMNVGWAPPGAARLGDSIRPDEVLQALLDALSWWYGAGDAAVARAYRQACVTIGRRVRVELCDEAFAGVAADVDDEGHLLVDVGMCLRTVAAGDVVHLR